MVVVTYILFPYCRYYIDPDATAYLSLTQHIAQGDYYLGISSLWNPLHAFIAGKFMAWGLAGSAYTALLASNVLGAALTIFASTLLFNHFVSSRWIQWMHALMLGVFWSINAYYQLTSDIYGVLGFILFVLIILHNHQLKYIGWNIVLGLVIAFSCIAKTYSFYIEVLILFIWMFYLWKQGTLSLKQSFARLTTVGSISLLGILPWLIAFHNKFGVWSISFAGKFNISTRIVGTTVYKDEIHALLPPSPQGALSYWEDPHWIMGESVWMYDSLSNMVRYIGRVVLNLIEWTSSMAHISFWYGGLWLMCLLVFCSAKWRATFNLQLKFVLLSFLLFPVGLILIHVEPRYLWPTFSMAILLLVLLLEQLPHHLLASKAKKVWVTIALATCFIGPVLDVKNMWNQGKNEYQLAQEIQSLGIDGSFFSNIDYASGKQKDLLRLSSFLQMPVYTMGIDSFSMETKLAEAKRYGIDYYFHWSSKSDAFVADATLLSNHKEVTNGTIPQLRIYRIKE